MYYLGHEIEVQKQMDRAEKRHALKRTVKRGKVWGKQVRKLSLLTSCSVEREGEGLILICQLESLS